MHGSFSSNGTPFQADGTGVLTSGGLDVSLNVSSVTSGGVSASSGVNLGIVHPVGVISSFQAGSNGLVSGRLANDGHFSGRYKANISNYRLDLQC